MYTKIPFPNNFESYNLSTTILGDIVLKSDFIVSVSFSPLDRYLAIGTRGGVLAIWRYTGAVRDLRTLGKRENALTNNANSNNNSNNNNNNGFSEMAITQAAAHSHHSLATATSAEDWELYSKVSLSSSIHEIEWSCGQGTLCVIADEGVLVLSESILRQGQCGELSILQVSSNEVSIHIGLSVPPWIEATGLLIKGYLIIIT